MAFSFCLGYTFHFRILEKRWATRKTMFENIRNRIRDMVDIVLVGNDMVLLKGDINKKLLLNAFRIKSIQHDTYSAYAGLQRAVQEYMKYEGSDAEELLTITTRVARWQTALSRRKRLALQYQEQQTRWQYLTLAFEKHLKEQISFGLQTEYDDLHSQIQCFTHLID